MAVFDLVKPVLPKAPLLLGNAIVFLLTYFSMKGDTLPVDYEKEVAPLHRTVDVPAGPAHHSWSYRLKPVLLAAGTLLPLGSITYLWTSLFRSQLSHDGQVGAGDLILMHSIWAGGMCFLDEFYFLLSVNKLCSSYMRLALHSNLSALMSLIWYISHLTLIPEGHGDDIYDPNTGYLHILDALTGTLLTWWFHGASPSCSFKSSFNWTMRTQASLCIVYLVHQIAGNKISNMVSELFVSQAITWTMRRHQLVLFGGETGKVLVWTGYAYVVRTIWGALLVQLWQFDLAKKYEATDAQKITNVNHPPSARKSSLFGQPFWTTVSASFAVVLYFPNTDDVLLWILGGGVGLMSSIWVLYWRSDIEAKLLDEDDAPYAWHRDMGSKQVA